MYYATYPQHGVKGRQRKSKSVLGNPQKSTSYEQQTAPHDNESTSFWNLKQLLIKIHWKRYIKIITNLTLQQVIGQNPQRLWQQIQPQPWFNGSSNMQQTPLDKFTICNAN